MLAPTRAPSPQGLARWVEHLEHPVFAGEPQFGIPMLLEQPMDQSAIDAKWVRLADRNRRWRAAEPTTLNFYFDDVRYGRIESRPDLVMHRGDIAGVVEANFSTAYNWPRVLNLHQIYRKRQLARRWQELGLTVFVDTHVADTVRHMSLLGVPRTHALYASKWVRSRGFQDLDAEWRMICEHRGDDRGVFVVWGGYSPATTQAIEARGWIHKPGETRAKLAAMRESED